MSKKTSKNRNTNKALKALKRKRASFRGGGYHNSEMENASILKAKEDRRKAAELRAQEAYAKKQEDAAKKKADEEKRKADKDQKEADDLNDLNDELAKEDQTGDMTSQVITKGLDGTLYPNPAAAAAADAGWARCRRRTWRRRARRPSARPRAGRSGTA